MKLAGVDVNEGGGDACTVRWGCTKRAHGGQSKVGSDQNSLGVVTCQLHTIEPQASNLFIEAGMSSLYPT